jgi:AraC-like DNA-binding protein
MPVLPVDVLWIARYDYGPGWMLRLHHHDYLQMIFFIDGKGVFTVGGRAYPIRGGELLLIRSGEAHEFRAETLVRTLDVKFRIAPGPLLRHLRRAATVQQPNDSSLAPRLERIRVEGEQKPPFYRELCSVLLTEILYLYLREDQHAAPLDESAEDAGAVVHDRVIERAIGFIRQNYSSQLTIREIARACGCTERTLRLHFHAVLRMKPLTYLQRFRIARAKTLIQYSDYALKEIAELVGFQSVHHFTRLFTASQGRSPARWQREYTEGIRKDVYINPRFENRSFTVEEPSELKLQRKLNNARGV